MATVIRGTDSSASAPALTGADSDTGVYFPAANQVALATNGTQALIVDSSQNVGIGTSSSGAKLQVKLPASGDGVVFRHTGSTLNPGLFFFVDESTSVSTIRASGSSFGVLAFDTSNSERARFDGSGSFLVGTTVSGSSSAKGIETSAAAGNETYLRIRHDSSATSGGWFVGFQYNGSVIGNITQSGTTATAYNTSSDYRLKNTIAPMTGALAKLALLKPCTYKWNADGSDGEGFIAHELAEVCPGAVTGEKDAVDAEGKPVYQGIDTSFLVATLTAAIQEQQAIITALTARVEALEAAQP